MFQKKVPSQEKLIKGKTAGTLHGSKKMYRFRFLWKEKPKNIQCVSAMTQTLIEIDLLRKAYCSLCTDTASHITNTVSYDTDTIS